VTGIRLRAEQDTLLPVSAVFPLSVRYPIPVSSLQRNA
jgi:hypothetical protein